MFSCPRISVRGGGREAFKGILVVTNLLQSSTPTWNHKLARQQAIVDGNVDHKIDDL